jgi:putative transposase
MLRQKLLGYNAMSHSINHQFIHLVWPTKNLDPLITEEAQASLLAYLTGILKGLGGLLLASSGTSNHVHLLANTPTDLSIAELLRQIKSCSSKWYREKYGQHSTFGWNQGYSAFTVSPASIDNVKQYLAAEAHRHKKHSFEDELRCFLKIQEIEFKPQFLINTTYTRLIYHLVWSVKNREPILKASRQMSLHQRIQQEVQKNGCKLYAIGNVALAKYL